MAEEWREVPGWSGYRVSDEGRVISTKRGRIRLLALHELPTGHVQVWLYAGSHASRRGVSVHRMVLEAFVGPCPEGMEACHVNDVASDNRLRNLYWGTHADNMRDRLRNGNNPFANRTHCKRGHEFTPENTRLNTRGARVCRSCERARWSRAA